MATHIHWFRNDLRLEDQPTLLDLDWDLDFLPVYVLDPRKRDEGPWGIPRMGTQRSRFLLQCLEDLDGRLRMMGSGLHVVSGHPEEVIPALAKQFDARRLTAQKEHTREELDEEKAVREALDIPLHLHEGHTLHHPEDLPFRIKDLPQVFGGFRRKVEKGMPSRRAEETVTEVPDLPEGFFPSMTPASWVPGDAKGRHPNTAFPFQGGATAAINRLEYYCSKTSLLGRYKFTRNGLLGADYSGKFSPWLALGAISPRTIADAVEAYELQHGSSQSSYWMLFELRWRDFFRYVAIKEGNKIFYPAGLKDEAPSYQDRPEDFEAWCQGRTGQPFVDANMRELLETGWMSNRGRQNVASYLVHDLKVDWRMGAAWFEKQLIDFDPCSNTGNWIYVAGLGNDPRPSRRFNPELQASRYDAKGAFVKTWLQAVNSRR